MGAVKFLFTLIVTTLCSVISCGVVLLITSVLYFAIPEQIKVLESNLGFSYLAAVVMVMFLVITVAEYASILRIFYKNV